LPTIRATTAVDPHYLHSVGYNLANFSSVIENALFRHS
jgi:hypothetical protein